MSNVNSTPLTPEDTLVSLAAVLRVLDGHRDTYLAIIGRSREGEAMHASAARTSSLLGIITEDITFLPTIEQQVFPVIQVLGATGEVVDERQSFEEIAEKAHDRKSSVVRQKVQSRGQATSFIAALSISPKRASSYYRLIYRSLQANPEGLTDEGIYAYVTGTLGYAQVSESGLRARRSELNRAGWVRDSGIKRSTKAGNPSIVWTAVK